MYARSIGQVAQVDHLRDLVHMFSVQECHGDVLRGALAGSIHDMKHSDHLALRRRKPSNEQLEVVVVIEARLDLKNMVLEPELGGFHVELSTCEQQIQSGVFARPSPGPLADMTELVTLLLITFCAFRFTSVAWFEKRIPIMSGDRFADDVPPPTTDNHLKDFHAKLSRKS